MESRVAQCHRHLPRPESIFDPLLPELIGIRIFSSWSQQNKYFLPRRSRDFNIAIANAENSFRLPKFLNLLIQRLEMLNQLRLVVLFELLEYIQIKRRIPFHIRAFELLQWKESWRSKLSVSGPQAAEKSPEFPSGIDNEVGSASSCKTTISPGDEEAKRTTNGFTVRFLIEQHLIVG
jgi:hypothetical protein